MLLFMTEEEKNKCYVKTEEEGDWCYVTTRWKRKGIGVTLRREAEGRQRVLSYLTLTGIYGWRCIKLISSSLLETLN
jgi:hypothetical protein